MQAGTCRDRYLLDGQGEMPGGRGHRASVAVTGRMGQSSPEKGHWDRVFGLRAEATSRANKRFSSWSQVAGDSTRNKDPRGGLCFSPCSGLQTPGASRLLQLSLQNPGMGWRWHKAYLGYCLEPWPAMPILLDVDVLHSRDRLNPQGQEALSGMFSSYSPSI